MRTLRILHMRYDDVAQRFQIDLESDGEFHSVELVRDPEIGLLLVDPKLSRLLHPFPWFHRPFAVLRGRVMAGEAIEWPIEVPAFPPAEEGDAPLT